MSTVLYPRITKKKVVPQALPDTFRVISIDAELQHQPLLAHKPPPDVIIRPSESRDYPTDERYHKPHPYDCGFLRHNVKLLNEPICTVNTRNLNGPSDYRPSAQFLYDEVLPVKPERSIFMQDFNKDTITGSLRQTRYGSNPLVGAASGIVPGTELDNCRKKDPVVTEQMSYEHMYNSRQDPNYPLRSKRHGGFVWKYPQPAVRGNTTTLQKDTTKDGIF